MMRLLGHRCERGRSASLQEIATILIFHEVVVTAMVMPIQYNKMVAVQLLNKYVRQILCGLHAA